jgi:CRISPR/Cas system-associated exonuclease Cas4 (RecB family)
MNNRYSAIQTAYTCYYKYKLQYIDKLEVPEDSGDMAYGTGVHLAMQAHFEGDDPLVAFNIYWDSLKDKPLRYTRDNWESLKTKGDVFITRWLRLHSKYYRPLYVEQRIATTIQGFGIEGTPDFVGYYKDVLSIVDFKTSAQKYDKRKIISNEQMMIYAKMVKDVYDLDVKQLVYSVFVKQPEPSIQVITLELTQAKLNDMISNVGLMLKDLSTRTEFPKNRTGCQYCSFFEKCYQTNGESNE